MDFIFRTFLTFNATSMMLIIYAIKENYSLSCLKMFPTWAFHIALLVILLLLTRFSIWMKRYLSEDDINYDPLFVEEANNSFLPTYLGYFFIALSVNSKQTMVFVYLIVFVFTFLSQSLYYNPLFLLFGYKFYYITTANNVKIFIISKKEIKTTKGTVFPELRRINNMTFIDEEEL